MKIVQIFLISLKVHLTILHNLYKATSNISSTNFNTKVTKTKYTDSEFNMIYLLAKFVYSQDCSSVLSFVTMSSAPQGTAMRIITPDPRVNLPS